MRGCASSQVSRIAYTGLSTCRTRTARSIGPNDAIRNRPKVCEFARRKTNTYAGPRLPKQIKAATKVNELAVSTLLLFLNALMAR